MIYEIKYINQFKTDKAGNPYKTKNDKPFVRVSIKIAEYGEQYISGLWFGENCPWKIGDKIDLEVKEEEYQGKKQLKFEVPNKEDKLLKEINSIAIKQGVIENKLDKIIKHLQIEHGTTN